MGLNIVAHRKVSLKGFAEGWDDCFIRVKAVNETRRREWLGQLGEKVSEEDASRITREACLEVIVDGRIMNTNEDGSTEHYNFSEEDIPAVLEALNFSWMSEVISVATGADRLKATISSL